jgi:hypothetical protein
MTSFAVLKIISRIGSIINTEKPVKSADNKLNRKFRINCFLYGGINRLKILKKSFIE